MVRGVRGGGWLFDGGDCLNIFVNGGNYPREAVYHGTAIIWGNKLWVHCMNGSGLRDKAANMTKQLEKKLISQHNKHSKFQPQQHLSKWASSLFYTFFRSSVPILFLLCNNNTDDDNANKVSITILTTPASSFCTANIM